MKRRKKRWFVLKVMTVVFAVCFSCFYFWVKDLYNQVDPDFKGRLSAMKLDTENVTYFHETLELVYPKIYNQSFIGHGVSEFIIGEKAEPCPCKWLAAREEVFIPHMSSIKGRFIQLSKIWEIESTLTQKECMNYILTDYDFLHGAIGVENAARSFFNKELEDLNLEEELEIIVMLKNSSLYDRMRRPELVSKAVQELKESIELSQTH